MKRIVKQFKKFKDQTILFLDYKKRNNHKIFHSTAKLIASDPDTDEAFKSMHQSIMTEIKNYASEYCIVLNVVIMDSIKILECQYKEKK